MDFWKNLWEKSFKVKGYRLGLHFFFWALYYLAFSFWDYFLLALIGWHGNDLFVVLCLTMVINVIVISLSYYLIIATAYRFLVKKHQYGWFFLLLFLNIAFFCLILTGGKELSDKLLPYLHVSDRPDKAFEAFEMGKGLWSIAQMVISYFALLCLPVASKFFRDQFRYQQRGIALEKQNLQLQMDFLKAQIHPHFLFNTLNNIYSLNMNAQSDKASEMIFRLSDLLRYVLYKGNKEYISLNDEVKMIRNFIELEAIRSDSLDINTHLPDQCDSGLFLPPFLLLPLVENAFKHGVNSQLSQSYIDINLRVSSQYLILEVENNFDENYRKKNEGGIGQANLRKRLAYYYSDQFTFSIFEKNNLYKATLKLPVLCPKYIA